MIDLKSNKRRGILCDQTEAIPFDGFCVNDPPAPARGQIYN